MRADIRPKPGEQRGKKRPLEAREGGVSDRQAAFHAKVESDRRKRAKLYFNYPGPWEFFFSEAGRAIAKSHPSAMIVYLNAIAKQPLPPKKRDRNRLEKLGLWPPKEPHKFSFPVEEGPVHGLGKKATARGLRILHEVGAIDRVHAGSATRGDYALYVYSERWREWKAPDGGPNFTAMEWKRAPVIAVRDEVTKQFVSSRMPKTTRKVRVVAPRDTSNPSLMAPRETREKTLVAPRAMNKAPDTESLVAPKAIFSVLTSTRSKKELKDLEGQEVKVRERGGDGALSLLPDDKRQFIFDLRRQVEEGSLPPRHARTKVVMPRIVSAEIAWELFPDQPKGGKQ